MTRVVEGRLGRPGKPALPTRKAGEGVDPASHRLFVDGRYDEAIAAARGDAARVEHDYWTNKLLAMCHSALGEFAEAESWTRRALGLQPFFNVAALDDAPRGRIKALVLGNRAQSQLRFDRSGALNIGGGQMGALSHLLPGSDFVRAIVFIDDDLDPRALGRQLARFDVVINGMADADANGRVLEWIAPHLAASPVPVLNPPDDVLANTRDRVYRQLDAIDDVVVPRTDRVLLEPPLARSLKDYVAANGFDLPILYRPAGSHAGRGLVRIAAPSDWPRLDAAFGTEAKAGPGYVSSFVDYADDDGIFAKFRLFCVGDDIVASHYLTARDWNVHWKNARAAMARDPALRRREVDFLDRFDDVTRPALEPRLRRIRDAVGLDFFGIDGALTRSGALLVFEANASMMISDRNRERDYPHLARPIARIKASFLDLVRARLAESGRAPPKETKGP